MFEAIRSTATRSSNSEELNDTRASLHIEDVSYSVEFCVEDHAVVHCIFVGGRLQRCGATQARELRWALED